MPGQPNQTKPKFTPFRELCIGFLTVFSSIASSDTTYDLIWTGSGSNVANGTVTFNNLNVGAAWIIRWLI